jgi:hypothetical protein
VEVGCLEGIRFVLGVHLVSGAELQVQLLPVQSEDPVATYRYIDHVSLSCFPELVVPTPSDGQAFEKDG